MADEGKKIVRMEKARAEKVAAFNRETYGEVIRASRLRRGLSQPQLAALLNTSKNYVSNWEHGRARPDMNIIPQLCAALGIRIAEFFGVQGEIDQLTPEQRAHIERYAQLNTRDQATVNALTDSLLRMEDEEFRRRCQGTFIYLFHNSNMAAAGSLNVLGDIVDGECEFIRRDAESACADEIITVTGDSMEPILCEGDLVLVRKQTSVDNGSMAVVLVGGEEGLVKKIFYGPDWIELHSLNPAYAVRRFEGPDVMQVAVLGLVMESKRKFI